jgi:oligopeptidase B
MSSVLSSPPTVKKIPHLVQKHGQSWDDPYFWLRERENPAVLAHLEAENRYTENFMADTKPLQEKLYQEILGRIKEADLSVPVKIGSFFYYTRTEKGKQYAIFCRKKDSLQAPEEIYLDQNQLAAGHSFFRVGVCRISPDHQMLAYSTDTNGSEMYTVYVKNLQSGELLPDQIPNTYANLEWAADNKTFFYTILDEAKRPYKLMRHKLGNPSQEDVLVHHEKDESFFLSVYKTKDRKFLMLDLSSKITSEIHYLEAALPESPFQLIQIREKKMEYSAEHYQGNFLIVTNDQAVNFRLMQTPVALPGKSNWKEIIPARAEIKLEGISVFEKHWAVFEREEGLTRIRIMNPESHESYQIDFPEPVYNAEPAGNPEFFSNVLRFEYTSMVTPSSVFEFDMNTRKRELKKQQEVLGGYDISQYVSERSWAISQDGTKVPISIVYKKGMQKNKNNFLFLYGYGSYGISIDPGFSSARLSLLDRGFIFAIAHIRGGGDLGRPWYENGKFFKKKNTFQDFIACAEHLIQEGYTVPGKLVIEGGSAGGLLMGAVTNMRPELFRVVIAKVPFVDVVNTMLDDSLPLTVTEYDEWGNPEEPEYFNYMKSYSPYDNVRNQKYPVMLITGGLNDPRVQYWEPAKWALKLREHQKGNQPVLLKMEMGSGHSGPSGRYEYLKEIAFDYAFLFKVLGIPYEIKS